MDLEEARQVLADTNKWLDTDPSDRDVGRYGFGQFAGLQEVGRTVHQADPDGTIDPELRQETLACMTRLGRAILGEDWNPDEGDPSEPAV